MFLGKCGNNVSSAGQGWNFIHLEFGWFCLGGLMLPGTMLRNSTTFLLSRKVSMVVGLRNVIFRFDFYFYCILLIDFVWVCAGDRECLFTWIDGDSIGFLRSQSMGKPQNLARPLILCVCFKRDFELWVGKCIIVQLCWMGFDSNCASNGGNCVFFSMALPYVNVWEK